MQSSKQVGGTHYTGASIQPFDVMRESLTREEWLGYLKGNVIKYMMRHHRKGGDEDLKKAHHYSEVLQAEMLNDGFCGEIIGFAGAEFPEKPVYRCNSVDMCHARACAGCEFSVLVEKKEVLKDENRT
ncbi:DUF3310 domain-containing protein [Candidatus Thiothrix sp. Deng01]|uniref:DUF3310 domain-containing protein n=1 Tax=Candidatus Thiothrix phosphatis TaxID=3112415 RepID=A0ABU6CT44_9GAMM|nr:DUF3310 domain-containing protein [Candidatus Thiothrix sp. Deng01]MEB4590007.1 DUF3310 domain-containing protein [Candidatus Thiothrix sp. Deng01]